MNTETEKVLRRYFPAMLGWMLLSSAGGGSEDIISARASKCQPRPRAGGWRARPRLPPPPTMWTTYNIISTLLSFYVPQHLDRPTLGVDTTRIR